MKRLYSFLTVLALGVFAAGEAHAANVIRGTITDPYGIGTPGIVVMATFEWGIAPETRVVSAVTDRNGNYSLTVYPEYSADFGYAGGGGTFTVTPMLMRSLAAQSQNRCTANFSPANHDVYCDDTDPEITMDFSGSYACPSGIVLNIPTLPRPVAPILRGPVTGISLAQ